MESGYLRYLGLLLLLASCLFIVLFVQENWTELRSTQIQQPFAILSASLVYGICVLLVAFSWPLLLRGLGSHLALRPLVRIGLVSQVGKYVPGNLAHYLGRGALAKLEGLTIREIGMSSMLEIILAVLAAVLVSFVTIAVEPTIFETIQSYWAGAVVGLGVLFGLTSCMIIWLKDKRLRLRFVLLSFFLVVLALILAGISFKLVVGSLGGSISPEFAIGIYAAGWVVGFATPGAPAGMGLREAVIIAGVSIAVGPGVAIAAALLHRLLTALVDGAIALGAWGRTKSINLSR